MEILISVAVLVVILLILGVSANSMIIIAGFAIFIILGIGIVTMLLMFIYFFSRMICSKKVTGTFVRIGKGDKWKFNTAYYLIDNEEFPCVFPSEPKIVYKSGQTVRLKLNRDLAKVFDKWAITTCTLGLLFFMFASAGMIYIALRFINF